MTKPNQPHKSFYISWWQRLHIDPMLCFLLLLLASLGLVVLMTASTHNLDVVDRQIARLGLAFSALFICAQIPARYYKFWTPYLYGTGLLLLLAVLIAGEIGKGAQRWLDLGFVRFQPSELMKIAVPMMIAWYFSDRPLPPDWKRLLIAFVMIITPTLMIAKQPDLGTSILILCSGVFVLFFAGLSWWLIGGLIVLGSCIAPIAWMFMHDYQRQRILTFIDPETDPLGTGYHIIQSKIAIGSGGFTGKGWFNGTQSHLHFLPERTTDFIFAVLGEEFGFVGGVVLLLVYAAIIARGLYMSSQAQDTFTRLLSASLTLTFCVYLVVNMGMVSGILPVVGIPLPLVSYGGTSMVTLMVGFGILMSIHTHRKLMTS